MSFVFSGSSAPLLDMSLLKMVQVIYDLGKVFNWVVDWQISCIL